MQTIYIVRHGQDEDNAKGLLNGRRDTPLTSLGESQAYALANNIKESVDIRVDTIFCSPLKRAHRTADIIAEVLELPLPVVLDDLIERDFGIMSGMPQDKIVELCSPDILKTPTVTYFLKPEGAETFPMLLDRAGKLLNRLKQDDGDVLLVTHGDFGKMLFADYFNLDWQDVLQSFHFGNSDLLELSPVTDPESAHRYLAEQYNL